MIIMSWFKKIAVYLPKDSVWISPSGEIIPIRGSHHFFVIEMLPEFEKTDEFRNSTDDIQLMRDAINYALDKGYIRVGIDTALHIIYLDYKTLSSDQQFAVHELSKEYKANQIQTEQGLYSIEEFWEMN